MSDIKEQVEQLSKQVEQLRATLDNVGVYVFIKDTKGRYTYANKMVRDLFGTSLDEIVGRDDSSFFDMAKSIDLKENDRRVLESGETVENEEQNIIADTGELRVYKSVKMPLRDKDDRIIGILGVSTDITELHKLKEELRRQSRTDYLTKLDNRRFFMEVANHEFERSVRYGEPLTVLLMDIDYFKNINDTYGHHVGDKVLCEIADTCREEVRDSDVLGRVGGEEFAILLPNTDLDSGVNLAERIRKKISSIKHTGEWEGTIKHTISIGIASLVDSDSDFESMLIRADKALYRAKDEGRDRVCTYANVDDMKD